MIKLPFPLSFGAKLTLWYVFPLILSVCVIFSLAYYLISSALFSRDLNNQQLFIQEIQLWQSQGGIRNVQTRLQNDPRNAQGPYFVRINDGARQSLFIVSSENNSILDIPTIERLPLKIGTLDLTFKNQDRSENWIILTTSNSKGALFQLGRHSTLTHEVLRQFRLSFLKITLPVLILAAAGGALFTFRALRPLRKLSLTTRHLIEHGNLSARVPAETHHGELNDLVLQFNRMLETNERLIRTMHDALDNVAHDLRTPITRLRVSAETALHDSTNPEASREALADCLEEAEKIQLILNTLMDVAEARTGVMHLKHETIPLNDLVQDVTELYSFVAEEQQMSFHVEIPETLLIRGDRSRLRQALANLLDNAIKYGSLGQTIELRAQQENEFVVLEIKDYGQGIPTSEIPRIWERLYRGDKSRNKRGLGLGLSLVQAIIQAHEGSINVRSELGKGTTFTLKLPTKN